MYNVLIPDVIIQQLFINLLSFFVPKKKYFYLTGL